LLRKSSLHASVQRGITRHRRRRQWQSIAIPANTVFSVTPRSFECLSLGQLASNVAR
jgi:hypothetical protein